jgi:hypothetical protein
MEMIGHLVPTTDTQEGRLLADGSLTATITSRVTHQHVTLSLRATRIEESGDELAMVVVPFAQATHVLVEDYDGLRLGVYDIARGGISYGPRCGEAERWSAKALLRYCAGSMSTFGEMAEIDSTSIEDAVLAA